MTPTAGLRAVMRPDLAANRMYRLADDLKDIERLDAAVKCAADEKTLAVLLHMKRRIKERMMKDAAENCGEVGNGIGPGLQKEIDQYYREIVEEEPPRRQIAG